MVEYGKAEVELAQVLEARYGGILPSAKWLEVAAAVIQLLRNVHPFPDLGDKESVEAYIKRLAPFIATIVVNVYSQLVKTQE